MTNEEITGEDIGHFYCHECGTCRMVYGFNGEGDPTTNSGACKVCGSDRWSIEYDEPETKNANF